MSSSASASASGPVPTTLGEEILLLSLDDSTGEAKLPLRTPFAIAAAALLERALVGGPEDAALPDDAEKWINEQRGAEYDKALRGLLDKGLVREEKRRLLLVFRTTVHPEVDGTVEAALRGRLAAVVLEGREPDHRTAALITLLHHADLRELAFPDLEKEQSTAVERRMTEIAERHWADPALRRMAETAAATSAALTAATMATTVVIITAVT
ncbi:GOLPH3/VPS74 family protein [Streptomyces neyagawaensis]|uniref:GOLPH3/VPS74 family protein n=1 Tax=Streptomyces neyagawaensis TaxID=42238 RepID=UPI001F0B0E34|nr:GPP34 family phosphoprotein [Streptomyces neyagawaensis]MCL6734698.1 GPP34 family phosphoprotein [Streptomyces neyagawaensis]MDE1682138.1 GPP34 family phosphoprotein [Streptomyces neyagawaensis]